MSSADELKTKLNLKEMTEVGNQYHLVGLLYAQDQKGFMALLPGESYPVFSIPIGELSIEDWQQVLEQTDSLWVHVEGADETGKIVKAMVRKCQRQIDTNVSWRVFKRAFYRCEYCGRDDVPLTVDHLVRYENGGPATEANLLAACRKCNRVRGDTEYGDWLNDPYYRKVSQKLPQEVRENNVRILNTLAGIKRVPVRSR